MTGVEIVLDYLPISIRKFLNTYLNIDNGHVIEESSIADKLEEIRLRSSKPLILKIEQEIIVTEYIVSQQEVLQSFEKICESSIYSYRKQICDGYITIKGGNRVGIVGSAVVDNGQVTNINYISSLNFRIASQRIGCSNNVMEDIIDFQNNSVYNTLIVSPPGCGKTTLLRDIIRNISNGTVGFNGKTVGIVDERGEIAAMYKGIPQNDIGIFTDVISNVSKAKGMNMLIRSMSPDIIACDEIGSKEDIEAISTAICSGAKGIFTVHGRSIEEIMLNDNLNNLLKKNIIERIFILNPKKKGDAECIYL